MNAKQAGIGLVVGTVVAMILGYLIFDLAAGGFYESNMGSATGVTRDSQLWQYVIIGTVAYVALILYASKGKSVADGLKTGAIVGLLLWGAADFIFLGIWDVTTLPIAIVDPILEAIRGGITGAVIAAVLAKV